MLLNTITAEPQQTPDAMAFIEGAKRGDEHATRKILQTASGRIRKTAKYLCAGDAERDDLVQNTLIEVVRALPGFKGDSSVEYWIDRITVFTASKYIDKAVRRRRIEERVWFAGEQQKMPDANLDEAWLRERFRLLLGEIKPAMRSPLVLHYLHGYTVDEIADLMQLKRNTVRGRLRTALKQMRTKVRNDDLLSQWIGTP
ncbi:MAG: sigma-70 family RNA polymerase sigma factor [Deltaproteobacteria bacterium]|nr:sigma-70 family RNA polymerase sigma factor [Deltaproteobacteria bacterium]